MRRRAPPAAPFADQTPSRKRTPRLFGSTSRDPDDRVFCAPTGGPLDGDELRDAFHKALAVAGLGHLRTKPDPIVLMICGIRSERSPFGVWPLSDVKAYMGHADIGTTMISSTTFRDARQPPS